MKTKQHQPDEKTIDRIMTVPLPVERAFTLFTGGLARWWPAEYTWSQEVLATIAIEPGEGGRCFERGPRNFECDWGRVLVWEPPQRLVFTWQISPNREPAPDPAKASEIEVRFEAVEPAKTQVTFEHRHLARHGEGAVEYQAALDSPEGWSYILERYVEAAQQPFEERHA